jgi:ATP-dependent Zn protease
MNRFYDERKAAYHEAAHAVIALYNGFPVHAVWIDGVGAGTTSLAWWHQFVMRFSGMRYIPLYLEYIIAGQAGEMFVRREGDDHHGSHEDQARAEYMRMVYMIPKGEFGAMRYRVSGWISDRRELIKAIGERLLIERKLSGREIKRMMNDFHKKYPHLTVLTRE